MAKTIQEALAEVQRKLDEYVLPVDANRPKPGQLPISGGSWQNKQLNTAPVGGSSTGSMASNPPTSIQRPAPRPAGAPLPRPAGASANAPARPQKYTGSIAQFQKENPGATVGQAMNAIQGKTAIAGGRNDPTVIAAQRQKDSAAGPVQPTYAPKADTTLNKGETAGQVPNRNTEPGYSGNAGAAMADALKNKPEVSNEKPPMSDEDKRALAGEELPRSNSTTPTAQQKDDTSGVESAESGPSKGKKKMSESALINAFMKLQQTKSGNIFEAAKKMKTSYEGSKGDEGDSMTSEPDGPANSMTNEPPKGEAKKKPEDYFKKDSPNAAEKPSEDEIDRRMRVALGHSKGPEDYFKIPNKSKSTEVAGKKDDDDKDNKSSASAETSVSIDGGVPSTTKVSKTVSVANKRKMSESTLIDAFLKINESKKAKKDYDGDGKIESGKDEYLGSRIAAAKKAGKMEEELKGNQKKIDANNNGKIDSDDFRKLRSGKKAEKIKAYRADRDKHGEMEEETDPGFSEAELAHFEAVINRKDQKGKERAIGDTVASEDLTDEYINEMARKPGETRGRKAGTKVQGGYKNTKSKRGGDDAKGGAVEADEPKGVPHVLDQIRHGREDEHGFKTITHPASSPEAPVTKKIHRSDLHGFYDKYHNTEKPAAKEKEYSGFLDKHFGDSRTSSPTSQSVTTDLSKVEKANLKGGAGKVSLGGSKLVGGKK